MRTLRCEDHPKQRVFLKVTTTRTFVGIDGKTIYGAAGRNRYGVPASNKIVRYICVAEMDDPELEVCDDLIGKEGERTIFEDDDDSKCCNEIILE